MKKIVCQVGLASLLLITPSVSSGASIMVTSTAKDTVGQSIVYNLREAISRSSLHNLVYSEDDAGFVINVVAIEQDNGNSAAYSAVLLMPPFDKKGFDYFIDSAAGFCGSKVTNQCAASILSTFDSDMADIAQAVADSLKKPK